VRCDVIIIAALPRILRPTDRRICNPAKPRSVKRRRSCQTRRSRAPHQGTLRRFPNRRIKEKAARIANAAAARGRSSVGKKGGKSGSYEDWTVDDLRKRVKVLGLSGYSGKNKSELVSMLRNH
jgi:hypothetical protein